MKIYNREKELSDLEHFYRLCVAKGISCGVLVYGWRRVGKTTILKEFVRSLGGVYINCIWISNPYVFLRVIMRFLPEEHLREAQLALHESDPIIVLKTAFDLLQKVGDRPIVVLDEFHVFIEKMALRIARDKKTRKDIVVDDILGILKDAVESKRAFWVLSTSMGWAKIQETITKPRKIGTPLIAVLKRYKIEPFDKKSAVGFAKWVNNKVDDDVAEEIYRLTGGIPRLIEVLASNYDKRRSVMSLAVELIREGEFDDFFENLIKFIAEAAKRDATLLTQTLKALGLEEKTTDQIASFLGLDIDSAYVLVEELVKLEVVEKRKEGRRSLYRTKYPLLPLWIELRVPPEKEAYNIIATQLGITLESYVTELLGEYANQKKTVEIWDDKEGDFLYGTAQKLVFKPTSILRQKEAKKKYGLSEDFDLLILTGNRPIIVEIKLSWTSLKKEDIDNIEKAAKKIGGIPLIIVARGDPKIPLIAYAVKKRVIIMSGEALRLLAKKIGLPHW